MKNFLLIGFFIIVLLSIPVTLFLVSNQTKSRSSASPATRMNFIPSSKTVNVNDNFQLDINLDPGQGTSANFVAFVDLVITYPNSLTLQKIPDNGNTGIKIGQVNGASIVSLTSPQVTCASQTCTFKVSLGMPPGNPIKGAQPIATMYFTATAPTDPNGNGAEISLAGSQALSSAVGDKPSDNVLIGQQSAFITISGPGTTSPTPTDSGSSSGGSSSGGGANGPLCTSLSADQTSAASAPVSVNFTAVGNSSSSTISKVTFNFGDGTVQDVTAGGGVGTNAVNAQLAHQYTQTGTFTATATLTDANNNVSTPASCSQTITVGQSQGGGQGSTTNPTDTPVSQIGNTTPAPVQSIPSTGPGETILGIGVIGAVIMVIGGALFGI